MISYVGRYHWIAGVIKGIEDDSYPQCVINDSKDKMIRKMKHQYNYWVQHELSAIYHLALLIRNGATRQ